MPTKGGNRNIMTPAQHHCVIQIQNTRHLSQDYTKYATDNLYISHDTQNTIRQRCLVAPFVSWRMCATNGMRCELDTALDDDDYGDDDDDVDDDDDDDGDDDEDDGGGLI